VSEDPVQNIDLTQKEQILIGQLYSSLEKSSHYILLGVPEDATSKQIRTAYYSLSRHWHPDRFFRKEVGDFGPQIESIFSAVTEAYQTLSNDARRSAYNRELEKERAERAAKAAERRAAPREVDSDQLPAEASAEAAADTKETDARTTPEPARRTAASRVRSRGRPSRYRKRVLEHVKKGRRESGLRAQRHHKAGMEDLAAGNPIKAESALYLAVKLDPRNPRYRADLAEAQRQARQIRARQFVAAAESAEQYQNVQEALYNYRKAVEYETDNANVYFRLGMLIRRVERDEREALKAIRTATLKAPDNAEFRIALAEMYAEQGLALNARREYQEATRLAKDKETRSRARDGLRQLR